MSGKPLNGVSWFNRQRQREPIGPAPYEQGQADVRNTVSLKPDSLRVFQGGSKWVGVGLKLRGLAPEWAVFDRDDRVMNLEPGKLGYFDASDAAHCTFWKGLYPTILTQ